ncbi:putative protein phosphatase 2C 34 [Glycine max]|nr:putative protein phosphatase 2C 34 [Glycine max]
MVLFPSLVNGLARTVSLKKDKNCRKDGGRKVLEALAKEARKNELLLTSSGIVKSSKANNVASVFTKKGHKRFNQDGFIVWEGMADNDKTTLAEEVFKKLQSEYDDHLQKLLRTPYKFGLGSRIIVTTRYVQVLNANKANETNQLGEFSLDKALELFNLNAFKQSDHQWEYDELSKRVVNYAKGNPLVLKVLAQLLCGKNKEEWEDVSDLKSLLKDYESEESVTYWLGRLKDKALITYSDDNIIAMHESLQEMALEIVRRESSEDPGSCSRLWDPNDIFEALKNDKNLVNLKELNLTDSKMLEELPDLSNARNLEVLLLLEAPRNTKASPIPSNSRCQKLLFTSDSRGASLFPKILKVGNCKSLYTLPKFPRFLKVLIAQDCTSLKTVLFPSTANEQLRENRKEVLFWNCLKLNQRSLEAIALNARINDEHLTKANIDDSRAVLPTTSEDGTLTPLQLTTDLKPYLPSLRSLLHTHNIRSVWDAISNQEAVKIVVPDCIAPLLAADAANSVAP